MVAVSEALAEHHLVLALPTDVVLVDLWEQEKEQSKQVGKRHVGHCEGPRVVTFEVGSGQRAQLGIMVNIVDKERACTSCNDKAERPEELIEGHEVFRRCQDVNECSSIELLI